MVIFLTAWTAVSILLAAFSIGVFVRRRTHADARRAVGFTVLALAVLVVTALWLTA